MNIMDRLLRDAEAWATTARNTVSAANTARLEREAAAEIKNLVTALSDLLHIGIVNPTGSHALDLARDAARAARDRAIGGA